MKKIFALLLAMTLICGMAYAIEGLSLGYEFRIRNIDRTEPELQIPDPENPEEVIIIKGDPPSIADQTTTRFFVAYEGAFVNENLEIEGEIGFGELETKYLLDIELEGRFIWNINPASNMTFSLNSKTDIPWDAKVNAESWLTTGIKWDKEFGFGNIFAKVAIPKLIAHDTFDAFDVVNLDLIFSAMNERKDKGTVSNFPDGFGGEIVANLNITHPVSEFTIGAEKVDGTYGMFRGLSITPFFSTSIFYIEVEVGVPLWTDEDHVVGGQLAESKGMDVEGISIIPKFEMDIPQVNGLSLWLDVPITNLGVDEKVATHGKDAIIGIGFGLSVNF
ncbi:MAG: hypothetical protein FWG98_13780 [Candidatus Cloacimonetes bacterium]|nr:hypothetical protein [Candidatus Cloacimonadota bacterium]